MNEISALLVDDHVLFRDGIRFNFRDQYPQINILGEAGSAEEMLDMLNNGMSPDVILLDHQMPGLSGIEATKKLREDPENDRIRIIILSAYKDSSLFSSNYGFVIEALEAGADGFLLKNTTTAQIVTAIEEVIDGQGFYMGETFNLKEAGKVIMKEQKRLMTLLKKERNFGLGLREVEVIRYMSYGLCAKEIACRMKITEEVVTTHKDHIKTKLSEKHGIHLKNMVEMVVWAIKNNVIQI